MEQPVKDIKADIFNELQEIYSILSRWGQTWWAGNEADIWQRIWLCTWLNIVSVVDSEDQQCSTDDVWDTEFPWSQVVSLFPSCFYRDECVYIKELQMGHPKGYQWYILNEYLPTAEGPSNRLHLEISQFLGCYHKSKLLRKPPC